MKRVVLALFVMTLATPVAQSDIDETRTTLREHVLKLINRDRSYYNLPPVQLDLTVSAYADDYCRSQIRNGTTGHFDVDGHTPYMRYSFAGLSDGVSENAAAWSAGYTFNERALWEMSRRSQDAMMGEMPPADGHRRTILDPHANYVGIGLAWEKGEFRLVQEFIRRYIRWTRPAPNEARLDEQVMIAGRPLTAVRVQAITVHHEPLPRQLTPAAANALRTYAFPDKRKDYLPRLRQKITRRIDGTIEISRQSYHGGHRGDFHLADNGSFSFVVPFNEGEGVYTVVVWVSKSGSETPIAASNISIRVERSLPMASVSNTTPLTTRSSSAAVPRD